MDSPKNCIKFLKKIKNVLRKRTDGRTEQRKERTNEPSMASPQRLERCPSPDCEATPDELVEQQKLAKNVGHIEQLCEQIEHRNVGAQRAAHSEAQKVMWRSPHFVQFQALKKWRF